MSSSFSKDEITLLTLGWVVYNIWADLFILFLSATVIKYCNCLKSIYLSPPIIISSMYIILYYHYIVNNKNKVDIITNCYTYFTLFSLISIYFHLKFIFYSFSICFFNISANSCCCFLSSSSNSLIPLFIAFAYFSASFSSFLYSL